MINDTDWNNAVNDSDTFYKKKNIRIKEINGNIFEGLCNGYHEDDDSNGDACWAICVGWRLFLQEDVESLEFLD